MNPRDRMVEELRELVSRWMARGESPVDGVWVFAYSASVGVETAPTDLRQEALDAVTDGLMEGSALD